MRIAAVACVGMLAVGAHAGRAEEPAEPPASPTAEEAEPDAAELLRRIDAKLFFPDAQETLAGYECRVSVTTGTTGIGPGAKPNPKSAKPIANVRFTAPATKTWTKPDGATIPPGTWTPFAGPWTLTDLVRFETELFLSPLAARFTEERYVREVEDEDERWRLTVTPLEASDVAPAPLRPVVTRMELLVGKDGVPTRGVLGLDQEHMKDDGTFTLEFADEAGRRRIVAIRNVLTSANLRIEPSLHFAWEKQSGFLLPRSVEFRVPLGGLSPTLGRTFGGDSVSALLFEGYVVKKAP